jgi:hypothetical protein
MTQMPNLRNYIYRLGVLYVYCYEIQNLHKHTILDTKSTLNRPFNPDGVRDEAI